ncbi:hypothetical protein [Microvirga sp. TS319]|uniref:hypothetical protein n=1 Tax=Microvirga sp. TS319 TaxID=3241165 RepID=UPI003519F3C7
MMLYPSPLLRQALLADATTTGAFGLLMLLAAGPLGHLLGLPEMLLRVAGAILVPYVAFLAWLSLRERTNGAFIWAVILGNVLWAADSLLLLVSGWVSPTGAGYAFVIAQALVVLMYAELQFMGLRRSNAAAA